MTARTCWCRDNNLGFLRGSSALDPALCAASTKPAFALKRRGVVDAADGHVSRRQASPGAEVEGAQRVEAGVAIDRFKPIHLAEKPFGQTKQPESLSVEMRDGLRAIVSLLVRSGLVAANRRSLGGRWDRHEPT
jgi:hypothetical protein